MNATSRGGGPGRRDAGLSPAHVRLRSGSSPGRSSPRPSSSSPWRSSPSTPTPASRSSRPSRENQELARLSAANLAAEISQFSLDLGSLTRQSDIAGGRSARQQAALTAASNKLSIFDAGTIILDAHGSFAAAWPKRPGTSARTGRRVRTSLSCCALRDRSTPTSSNDGVGGAQVIAVAVPIIGPQGEFNGVLAGMFRVGATSVSALYGDIAKLRVGVSGDVYLVDGNGRVIAHPDPALVGTDLMSRERGPARRGRPDRRRTHPGPQPPRTSWPAMPRCRGLVGA